MSSTHYYKWQQSSHTENVNTQVYGILKAILKVQQKLAGTFFFLTGFLRQELLKETCPKA